MRKKDKINNMQAVRMDKAVDNVDWITDENTKVDMNSLPELPGYHLLILPVSIKKKTKGGIILPDKIKDDVAYLTTVGRVLKAGDLAYGDEDKFPKGPWCNVGDYICYAKYTGQKFVYKGLKLLLIFDDQVIMKVEKPSLLDPTYQLSN
jgi:co-chaperonin GroES (HSP10)|tara:strand:+ start:425 stop:871 length:447 start_codon:yes stop_codon:yes gene_type:complete